MAPAAPPPEIERTPPPAVAANMTVVPPAPAPELPAPPAAAPRAAEPALDAQRAAAAPSSAPGPVAGAVSAAVAPVGEAPAAPPARAMQPPPRAAQAPDPAPAPRVDPATAAESLALMTRGDEMMRIGDPASARLFYERAAGRGLARGFTAVGRSYDPVVLERLGIRGGGANAERALSWYRRGQEAGDAEAGAVAKALTEWLARR